MSLPINNVKVTVTVEVDGKSYALKDEFSSKDLYISRETLNNCASSIIIGLFKDPEFKAVADKLNQEDPE